MTKLALEGYSRLIKELSPEEYPQWAPIDEASGSFLDALLEPLQEENIKVLRMYYGLDGMGTETLKEVAKKLAISLHEVQKLRNDALRYLRHPNRMPQLIVFINGSQKDRDTITDFYANEQIFWKWLWEQKALVKKMKMVEKEEDDSKLSD